MRLKQESWAAACAARLSIPVLALFAFATPLSASGQTVATSSLTAGQAPAAPAAAAPAASQPATAGRQPDDGRTVLALSADDAVRMALENNLGVRADRLSPQIESLSLAQAKAVYAPTLVSQTLSRSSTQPPSSFLTGSGATLTSDRFAGTAGVQQLVPWAGGRYSLEWDAGRSSTNDAYSRYNPQLDSAITASYTQPLLRDLTIDSARQQVLVSEKRVEVADLQLQQTLTQTSRLVRNAYFDLVGAIAGLDVAQQSLDLARQSLRNNQRRVEVGTMAPIDIVQAEAEVAANEESVILAEGQIRSAEDRLRTLVMNPSQPDFWTTRLEPSEQPTLTPQPVDVDAAVRNALANRTDIAQQRKALEQIGINERYYSNQRLPALDLTGSYNLVGTAGTQREFQFDATTGIPTVLNESQRSFSKALADVFGNDFRTWSVQLNISYPLGRSVADAALAQSRIARQQQATALQDLETQVVAAVREAGRQVMTNLKRVESTRKARELAEQSLQAEEKRLAVGLSDTFRLFQAQRDLSRQKVNELNAVIAYNRALIDFEAVQAVPVR
jgi:outer membrane protein TolC